jgi:hypothetical protein
VLSSKSHVHQCVLDTVILLVRIADVRVEQAQFGFTKIEQEPTSAPQLTYIETSKVKRRRTIRRRTQQK